MAKVWKICQFLIITTIFLGFVPSVLGQTQVLENKFTVSFKNISYESVIDSLRAKVNAGFSYNPDFFPKDKKYTYHGDNQKLRIILDSLLIPVKFTYKMVDNNIVIVPLESNKSHKKEPYAIEEIDTMKVIKLSGKVLDRKDKKPIEFTSIYVQKRNIATMTNTDGNFTIKLPKDCIDDSVFFSCIGYRSVHKKIGDLMSIDLTIMMDINSIQLSAVKVTPLNPKEIIKKTIENIRFNYSRIPLNMIAFYREVIQQNSEYVGLSEAVLNIYKAPYYGVGNDQVSIFKGRRTYFLKQMDTVTFKFQGGISTSLMLDIAKNPSNFLTEEYLGYYDFTLDEAVIIDGRLTYVLGFDQTDYCPYSLFKGKLFIDIDTYSLVRAEFMISPKALENSADVLVRKSSRKLKVKPTFSLYIVNYTLQNHTWYLNYIREEVAFRVRKKYSFYRTTFRSKAEMLITQTDSVNVQHIKFSKQVHYTDVFFEKIGKYDPEYWGGFNILRPDESMEEALYKIKNNLRKPD